MQDGAERRFVEDVYLTFPRSRTRSTPPPLDDKLQIFFASNHAPTARLTQDAFVVAGGLVSRSVYTFPISV